MMLNSPYKWFLRIDSFMNYINGPYVQTNAVHDPVYANKRNHVYCHVVCTQIDTLTIFIAIAGRRKRDSQTQ